MVDDDSQRKLQFGPFELSSKERVLRRDGVVLPLGSRALDILIYLAGRPGEVIAKQELIDHVWSDVTVEEGSIRVHVAAIRKALGDGQFGNRYIANIKGRGYSFVGTVVALDGGTESRKDKPRHQGRLPVRPVVMVGREAFVSEVSNKLRDERFVTLLGPGGIGKTTIALVVGRAAAEEFGGDVYFVDLGSVTDRHHVTEAVATSLGFALKSKDPDLQLVDRVRSQKLLIILDSCEHVIETVALLAEQLYQETEQVYLLATSRELLKVEGEHCCRVLPLDVPPDGSEQTAHAVLRYPAAQLFVRRVAARAGSVVLTDEEAPLVAEICRKLDGIPLAIELAAGQVAALGLKNTASRLVSRLELLKLSHRTAVSRHRTLKATLDWSYDLLSDAERIVLRRIAPFVGHFTLEGARSVAGEVGGVDGEIFDAIAGLAEKSLIVTRIDEAQPQYRLLDTTRAYALEKLEEHNEFDPISRRHAEYVIQQLESQKEKLSARTRAERVAAYSWQLSNVRSALEWSFGSHGNDEIATRFAAASAPLFMDLGLLIEWQAWAERALARLGNQHKNARQGLVRELMLLTGLFMSSSWTSDTHLALDVATRSQKVALKTQDPDGMAHVESMLGYANHLAGRHSVAQGHFEAGLRRLTPGSRLRAGHQLFHPASALLVGMTRSLFYRGILDQSLDYARFAIEEGEKSGLPSILGRCLILLLPVYLALDDWQRSEHYIAQLTDLSATHSLKIYHAIATGLRGKWFLLQSNVRDGIPLLKRSSEELEAQGDEMLNMGFVSDLAEGLAASGQHEEALTLVVNALDFQQRGGKLLNVPDLMNAKGLILASRSAEDYPEAERSLLSSIEWARGQSAPLFELKAATDLAELLLKQGRVPEAYKHLRAALDRTPAGILSRDHKRALQILNQLQSGTTAVG
ncbi:winged helix-turn-helix domain-containing protein [Bradyrhizobium sp. LTSPM299]|uniref:ATP-binding protein n=1 Tax=Bradyrhizobium sp. LTSPM299 TaxID=1619233 RepID=UPI000A5A7507|nr:winged helix-turn-helix domain-containing protein [Bradyrhizobium sp. LTSPM299]